MIEYGIYLFLGSLVGFLAGLFGIGGGILIVPALAFLFAHFAMNPAMIMHVAVGTSLAIIIVNSGSAIFSHHQLGAVRWGIVHSMLPGVMLGIITGSFIGYFLTSHFLHVALACYLFFIGCLMLHSSFQHKHQALPLPNYTILFIISLAMGLCSGLLGIGTGTLLIPFLAHRGISMNHAAGTTAALTFPVVIVGTVMFMLLGFGESSNLAWSTGYVYWPAFVFVTLGTFFFIRFGARLSKKLPNVILKRLFVLVLFGVSLKMLV